MAANVHPKIIQQVMRHSTIKLTMNRYTHVFAGDEARGQPVARPERRFRRRGAGP